MQIIENEKLQPTSEIKLRKKQYQSENSYNYNDDENKKHIEQFKLNELIKEISFSDRSFNKSNEKDKSDQYERRFTNKINIYLNTIKQNLDHYNNKN